MSTESKTDFNEKNVDNSGVENENEMLVKKVKEIDYLRDKKMFDIMELKSSDTFNDAVRAFVFLMTKIDTEFGRRSQLNNPLNETETFKYDPNKEDPFKYFTEHWNEFENDVKKEIYRKITYCAKSSSSYINTNREDIKEHLKKTGKQFEILNKLERKVHLLRFFISIIDDLRKWKKTEIYIWSNVYSDEKEINKFNEEINGWFYNNKYIYSEYSFTYKIAADILQKYHLETQIKKRNLFAIFKIMDKKTEKLYEIKVIFRFVDEDLAERIFYWDRYILKKVKHKNIIYIISMFKDENNYYIITPHYKHEGFVKNVRTLTKDPLIREKIAASCTLDMLLVLKYVISKNIDIYITNFFFT